MEKCCNKLKDEIKQIEKHLSQVGGQIKSAAETGVDKLETDMEKAIDKCELKREQTKDAALRIKQLVEETKNDVIAKVEDWQIDHGIEKLEKQADKKEQRAIDAIMVAAFTCLEAEVAIMDALKARKMAVEIAGQY